MIDIVRLHTTTSLLILIIEGPLRHRDSTRPSGTIIEQIHCRDVRHLILIIIGQFRHPASQIALATMFGTLHRFGTSHLIPIMTVATRHHVEVSI